MAFDLSSAAFKPKPVVPKRIIPSVSSELCICDVIAGWKVRWGIGRSQYRVKPDLYSIGVPTPESPVLVTANYKLTFDALRKELSGIDAWILVLDTVGVNVWCTAGKGTFGTAELIRQVDAVRLATVVSHRILVLPQLGAPGVAAHEVSKATGFRVVYGPVRAKDIPAFLAAGMKKDDAMRRVEFGLVDRLTVAPVELSHAWPFLAGAIAAAALLSFLAGGFTLRLFGLLALLLISPIVVGAIAFPALLPVLPFKPFVVKGAVLGLAWSAAAAVSLGLGAPETAAYVLISTSIISFISMNFTGSSTYTNLSGATLEVKVGLPIMIAASVIGTVVAAFHFIPLFFRG